MLGKTELSEFSPLQFLINNLNSAAYNGVALPFLIGAGAQGQRAPGALWAPADAGPRTRRSAWLRVLARSGDQSSIAEAQKLTTDPDTDVAQEALRTVRTLQARL